MTLADSLHGLSGLCAEMRQVPGAVGDRPLIATDRALLLNAVAAPGDEYMPEEFG